MVVGSRFEGQPGEHQRRHDGGSPTRAAETVHCHVLYHSGSSAYVVPTRRRSGGRGSLRPVVCSPFARYRHHACLPCLLVSRPPRPVLSFSRRSLVCDGIYLAILLYQWCRCIAFSCGTTERETFHGCFSMAPVRTGGGGGGGGSAIPLPYGNGSGCRSFSFAIPGGDVVPLHAGVDTIDLSFHASHREDPTTHGGHEKGTPSHTHRAVLPGGGGGREGPGEGQHRTSPSFRGRSCRCAATGSPANGGSAKSGREGCDEICVRYRVGGLHQRGGILPCATPYAFSFWLRGRGDPTTSHGRSGVCIRQRGEPHLFGFAFGGFFCFLMVQLTRRPGPMPRHHTAGNRRRPKRPTVDDGG